MRKLWCLSAFSLLFLISCDSAEHKHEAPAAGSGAETKVSQVKLVSDKDPVCGMTVGAEPADTTLLNGNVYGFCSDDCKATFLKDSAAVVNHQ